MKEKYAFLSITTWLCFAWFCKLLLLGWGKWMITTSFNLTFSFAFLPDFLQIFYCAGKSQNLKSCPIRWKRWKVRTLVQCSPRYLDEEELESEEELEDEDEAEEALFLVLGGILEVAMQPAESLALSSTCWVSDLKRRLISLICGFRLNPLLQCFQWKFTLLQSTAAPRTKTVNRAEVWFGARTVSLFWAGRRCCHTRLPKFTEKLEIPKDYQTFTMLQWKDRRADICFGFYFFGGRCHTKHPKFSRREKQ